MSKLSEDKRELLAYIDAILTMIEKYPTFSLGNMFSDIGLMFVLENRKGGLL